MMTVKTFIKKSIKAILPYMFIYAYEKLQDGNKNKLMEKYLETDFEHRKAVFVDNFLKINPDGGKYFDIKGAKLPDISDDNGMMKILLVVFEDTFTVPYFFNDCHSDKIVELIDVFMSEGPYGYADGIMDVTVKEGDVVVDAGAWIGDFSSYAASKGATSYAFEPVSSTFNALERTAKLNNDKIVPVKNGLSAKKGKYEISIVQGNNSGANSMAIKRSEKKEVITITTLDDFAKENNITKIDFVKCDVEGEERNMLKGAYEVLRTFEPKLAICTYHFPEDPELLEKIILDANPQYKIKHLRHKLFAEVIK